MALLVNKFGGSSVADKSCTQHVAQLISKLSENHQVVAVVSARYGQTNTLLKLAQTMSSEPSPREVDMIVTTGEQVSAALLSIALQELGHKSVSLNATQAGIHSDGVFGKGRITHIDPSAIKQHLADGCIVVVTGFQGIDEQGQLNSLGRGGSDQTAVALASALDADECRMYKDVPGILTADPKVVDAATRLDRVSFDEMLEMSSLGAKVLQTHSVELARAYQVPLRILPLDGQGEGTLIIEEEENKVEKPSVIAVLSDTQEVRITVTSVPDVPGVAYQILGPIAQAYIVVDMIVQSSGHNDFIDFTFTIPKMDLQRCLSILELNPLIEGNSERQVRVDEGVSKISIVGSGMRTHAGVASTMFKALADEGINIKTISTSEIKVSVIIDEKYTELAIRTLHKTFNLG